LCSVGYRSATCGSAVGCPLLSLRGGVSPGGGAAVGCKACSYWGALSCWLRLALRCSVGCGGTVRCGACRCERVCRCALVVAIWNRVQAAICRNLPPWWGRTPSTPCVVSEDNRVVSMDCELDAVSLSDSSSISCHGGAKPWANLALWLHSCACRFLFQALLQSCRVLGALLTRCKRF